MPNRLPLVRVGGKTVQIPVGDALQLRGAINEAPAAQLVSGTNYEPSTETISWDSVPSNSAITLPTGSNGYSFMFGAAIGSVRRLILRAGDYLQHNDGFVELPTKAAITATDGDVATFQRRASSGNRWVCISYVRGDGRALVTSPDNTKLPLAGGQMTGPFNEAYGSAAITGTALVWGANGNAAFVSGSSANQIASISDPSVTIAGAVRRITFVSPDITLVHSNNLSLPTQANIVVKNGDSAIFQADAPNAWRCISYSRIDGTALASTSTGPTNTDGLPEGSTNKYFTAARVLATVLAGFATSVGAVTAADTILAALGKLEGTKAPLASPTFTGTPAAPTAAAGTSTTQLATTAFASNAATTAASAAAAASVPTSSVGAANGVAPLGSDSKIAAAYLPSYVDDVLEYANLAAFPATGEAGKIYIALDTNREYRWSGSTYIQLVASPGTTDNVPEGTTNLYFTGARVLATVLNGLSLLTGSAVTSADSVLVAIGKLQAQSTAQDTAISGKEPTIAVGATSQYWNGAKSFVDFATSVRAAVLAGLSLSTSTPVTAADTTLVAFGKLQAQITALGGAFRVENVAATTVGQTSFPIPNGYTAGAIMVFFKGVLQAPADYTASDGVNVVLAVGADAAGDILSVGVVGAVRAQDDALLSYTVAGLPSASANTAKLRYCTNMAGGAGPVFSNGTNWLRVADNTVVTT